MPKAFISYKSTDATFADLVKTKLEAAGIDVWLDQGALRPGEEWGNAIDDGIKSADALLVIITPGSCASPYVTYEWSFALGIGIKVIPLLLEKADIHPRLRVLQYLNFIDQRRRPWKKLLEATHGAVVAKEDPALAKIEGIYWSGNRHYTVRLNHIADGLYVIQAADWDGAGKFNGTSYVGFYQYEWVDGAPQPSTWGGTWGLHRAILNTENGSLKQDMIELDEEGNVVKILRGGTWQRAVQAKNDG